jgi:hypothetical protein
VPYIQGRAHKLTVLYENKVLRGIFVLERGEVAGGWRKFITKRSTIVLFTKYC